MNNKSQSRPVVLCILDGWGERKETENNAVALAKTPVWDRLKKTVPGSQLQASEQYVGLPPGQMGNSEVGHMNLGAGRVVTQDLPRIDQAIDDGSLQDHKILSDLVIKTKMAGGRIHLAGLLGPGGVHSHQKHTIALAKILLSQGALITLHLFLDGRDTPPRSAKGYLLDLLDQLPGVPIGTLCGRFFAMDRDKRWDRVNKAYNLLADGAGEHAIDPVDAIEKSYLKDITDEFLQPVAIGNFDGIHDGDSLLMSNFRADRAREILSALLDDKFDGFRRNRIISLTQAVGMVEYSETLQAYQETLFPPQPLKKVMGEIVATAKLKQLRIAETEKYAHVTFFFNGGEEACFDGEDRILVPSPKVSTYDLQPEMSAVQVTDKLVAAIQDGKYDFILVNYANTDMVGHTGILKAAISAVEAVDACVERVEAAVKKAGGVLVVTADHGNVETMLNNETGEPHTAHTCNPVRCLLVGDNLSEIRLENGKLADIAPTMLELMGLGIPTEMSGKSLLRSTGAYETAG
ncbi:MAG: phosphoglycerate mutase (2,3-diphosphoglycerate-independent) [Rhodospirillaceae bacterium]|nr:phosphoglycerate mutase (2,3-diphosphoglycerate-independent) [Rhodospirillaceae bacterium]